MSYRELYEFLAHDLWRTTGEDFGRGKRIGISTLKTIILAVRGFLENDLNMRANSLTYSFMFALVPILAMIIAVARGFGFEQVIEDALNKSFLGNYNIVPTIMGFVQKYLETAQGGVFLGIGIFILLWAVYSFFRSVESSMNAIWQVQKNRSIVRQIANYLTVLVAIPILIITSSGISLAINTRLADIAFLHMAFFQKLWLRFLPWIMTWVMFFLLYMMVPNTKVKLKSAIIPAILVGTLVNILEMLSLYIIMFLSRTSIVYGTFAAIPLLLIWMQWTCLLILIGAQMSYAIQNNERFDFQTETEHMSRRYKDYLTLYITRMIVRRFEEEEQPYTAKELAKECHLPVRIVNQLLSRLCETHVMNKVMPTSSKDEVRYQPAFDIASLTIGKLFEHINEQGTECFFEHVPEEMNAFWARWTDYAHEQALKQDTLVKDITIQIP